MLNIERYIARQVVKPLLAVVGIGAGLFATFSAARYLAEAVTQSLGPLTLISLVLLKTLIALEVLVPVALYVAIIVGLGRLHRDQEIIALRASGISGLRVVRGVLLLAVPVSILVGALSLFGRPWAYRVSYDLDARTRAEINPEHLDPGRFYGNEDSGRVTYVQERTDTGSAARGVFLYRDRGDRSEIVMARSATEHLRPDDRHQLELHDGKIYRVSHGVSGDTIVQFRNLVLNLKEPAAVVGYKRKAAANSVLWQSSDPEDTAELQWRLSRGLATLLLALLAVPLSHVSPRHGRNERAFLAAVVFAVYYNLSGLARTWVEHDVVGKFPGVWWLHAVMFLLVLMFLMPEIRGDLAARA